MTENHDDRPTTLAELSRERTPFTEHVDAILPYLTATLRTMLLVQFLAAMRPAKLCIMRAGDIDTTGPLWMYTPRDQTPKVGVARCVWLGPAAQTLLRPFMQRGPVEYLFSPADARTSRAGANLRACANGRPRKAYTSTGYTAAIANACDRAFPPPVHLQPRRVPDPSGMRCETTGQWRRRLAAADLLDELDRWRSAHRLKPGDVRHEAAALCKRRGLDEGGAGFAQTA